jgi:hypothetical protein
VKVLTKEKKEKENVLIDLELINMKNISLIQYEEFKKMTTKVEREQGILENFIALVSIVGMGKGTKEEFGSSRY